MRVDRRVLSARAAAETQNRAASAIVVFFIAYPPESEPLRSDRLDGFEDRTKRSKDATMRERAPDALAVARGVARDQRRLLSRRAPDPLIRRPRALCRPAIPGGGQRRGGLGGRAPDARVRRR